MFNTIASHLSISKRRPPATLPHNLLWRSYISIPDIISSDDDSKMSVSEEPRSSGSESPQLPRAVKTNGRFYCPWNQETKKRLPDVVKYLMTRAQEKSKLQSIPDSRKLLPIHKIDVERISCTKKPHITWIGHATCYYQVGGVRFITDPVFSDRASPFQFYGPKRFVAPPIALEQLPIDVVLLSHTHYDHLDEASARKIGNKALWLVPLGVKEILRGMGVTNCVELDWWQSYHYNANNASTTTTTTSAASSIEKSTGNESQPDPHAVCITFTPAKHWTARSFWDRNTCLWGSFAVQSHHDHGGSFFFSGDTAYCDVFQKIGNKFGGFDLAAIPIGAYSPRWFMKNVHCNPEEAVQIHTDLKSKESVGIHWGTFGLADEDYVEPALELSRARAAAGLSARDFYTMRHGETLRVGEDAPRFDFASIHQNIYDEYLQLADHTAVQHSS